MKKTLLKTAFLFGMLFSMVFFSCSNSVSSGDSATECGSLTVNGSDLAKALNVSSARALDISDIAYAKVSLVSSDISTDLSVTVDVTDGKASATISNIPVGINRIVKVQALDSDHKVLKNWCISSLTDIVSGNNSVSVDWDTSAKGRAYLSLLENNVEIASLNSSEIDLIDASIPECKGYYFDSLSFAVDYGSDGSGLQDSSFYVLTSGSVSFMAYSAEGYTVQIMDPVSETTTVTSNGENSISEVAPGTWTVKITDTEGNSESRTVTVVSGEDSDLGNVGNYFDGKYFIFVKADSAPYLWAYENTGSTTTLALSEGIGDSWNSAIASAADAEMMYDPEGWYYKDYSSLLSSSSSDATIYIHVNKGSAISSGFAGGTTIWYDGSSFYDSDPTIPGSSDEDEEEDTDTDSVFVYISASSAPSLWIWQPDGLACTDKMGYSWSSQPVMEAASDLNYNEGWYVFEIPSGYYTSGKTFTFIINSSNQTDSGKTSTFWYDFAGVSGDSGTFYDSDPTVKPDPVSPSVTIKPVSGKEVGVNDSITVTFNYGYDEDNFSASVSISGNTYRWGSDFTGNSLTVTLASLGYTSSFSSGTISVSASCSNSAGSASDSSTLTFNPDKAEDPFTWDNVNCYFVLTDRFYNAVSGNDHSYYRQSAENNSNLSSSYYNVATFHGGDIAGLTEKIDYLNDLGVNAIWITAPYEQAHGWCTGGGNGFAHYAFHGYYTLDWTYMDQNMGTIEEFRTFVNACHSKGIRVVMDVVMNHTGYNTVEDMMTYQFGNYSALTMTHGWCSDAGDWNANPNGGSSGNAVDGYTYNSDYWSNSYWDDSWWGCWIRSFGYSSYATGGDLYSSLAGLPDIRTEMTDSVSIPAFLKTKWTNEVDTATISTSTGNTLGNKYGDYKLESVSDVDWYDKSGDWRSDGLGAPSDYQVIWLSGWVREFGIDGFRCDTAKHVDMYRWGQLKDACTSALEAWRSDTTKDKTYNGADTGAADWDEGFWMTGECFGWTSTAGSGDYYSTGKFDSMINFSFNPSQSASTTTSYPGTSTWSSYLSINSNGDSDGNGNRNNVLTYISSHDTALCRASNQAEVGTMLQLTPGGIQIFYGDECSRGQVYTGCGDTDMMTRGDMDFASNSSCVSHWGKVGTFRKYNPAVGAGTGTEYLRTYSGSAGENKVAISVSGTSIDVSSLWTDGTTVYNWYDGTSSIVSSGSVSFSGGTTTQPILVSEKNPADYGITF